MLNTDNALDRERMAKVLLALRGKRPREEVAEAIGISIIALKMYESAQRVPRDEVKMALARYYNTDMTYIF